MPVVNNDNNGNQPIKTGLSQIEREFQAVNSVSPRREALGSILSNQVDRMTSTDLSGGMATGAPTTGAMLAGADRSKYDPTRAAAEDEIMRQARDRSLYASMNPSPQYGEAGPSGVLPLNQYHPSAGENIIKGYVQGSRIGSNPVFAAGGGLFPVGMLDARRQVMMNTASRNAASKQQKDLDFDAIEASKFYEGKIRDYWWANEEKLMNDAFREYGSDAGAMLNNPNTSYGMKRQKLHQQLESLGGITQVMETRFNDKLKALKSDETASPVDIARMEGYLNGMNEELNRLDPNMTDKEIGEMTNVLRGLSVSANQHLDMMNVYDGYMKNMRSDFERNFPQAAKILYRDSDDDGNPWTDEQVASAVYTYEHTFMDEKRLKALRDEIWNNGKYKNSIILSDPGASEEQHRQGVFDALKTRFPEKTKWNVHSVKQNDGSASRPDAIMSSKKYEMYPITPTKELSSQWPGNIYSVYDINPKGSDKNVKWQISFDNQVFFPGEKENGKETPGLWYGNGNQNIFISSPKYMVADTKLPNGNTVKSVWLIGTTEDFLPEDDEQRKNGVLVDSNTRRRLAIPLSTVNSATQKGQVGVTGGTSAISSVATKTDWDYNQLLLFTQNGGAMPQTITQNGVEYKFNPATGKHE